MKMQRKLRFGMETLEARDVPAVFATGSAVGEAATVTLKDSTNWATLYTVNPFNGFTGGIQTAVADVNGDGVNDCIAAQGLGGSPTLAIYNGANGQLIRTLIVGDANSLLGASVASAGKNASNEALLAVGSIKNGVATVQIIKADGTVVSSVTPFGTYAGAISVATADVNSDGIADVIVGAGRNGGPRVKVINGATGATLFDKFMFEDNFIGGVNLGTGDLNGDGKSEIVVSAGLFGGPRVRVLNTTTWTTTQDFFAYESTKRGGVHATVFTATAGGTTALVTTDGPGESGPMKAFNGTTFVELTSPGLPGLPGGPALTITPPTLTPSTTPVTDAEGMVSVIPDINDSHWVTQASGLKIWDVTTGTGTAVVASSSLKVFYTGWLLNGTVFDSRRTPATPVQFALSGLIPGWKEGLLGMQPGGIRRLYIPAALAYGSSGSGASVPPNSDLVFEIKLTEVV